MEVVIRVTVVYLFLLVGLRILGKREFGELSALELLTLLLVPELVSDALVGEHSLTDGLVGVATLFSLVFITSLLSYRIRWFEHLVGGKPALLVVRGQLMHHAMHHERVSEEEIVAAMHRTGIDDIKDVRWAVLESDGKISIVPEDPQTAHSDNDD